MRMTHLAALLMLAGCGHAEPWSTTAAEPRTGPHQPATPLRLTYNPLPDLTPAWLPDGSAIIYSATMGDRFGDRCLMLLPPEGGTVRRGVCYEIFNDPPIDSLRMIAWPAISPGGRLIYSSTTSRRLFSASRVRQLKWGTLDANHWTHQFMSAPTDLFGGRYLNGIAYLRWLDEQRIVYRADFLGTTGVDSVNSGRYIVLGTFEGDSIRRVYLPNTDHASSVAVLPGDTLLFTRNNDSRLYALALATGALDTLHDFGAVTRDVHAVGNQAVVVVGGFTQYLWAPAFVDSVQIDRGGELWLFNRATGATRQLAPDDGYTHPVIAPDGRKLVTVARGDLFRVEIP